MAPKLIVEVAADITQYVKSLRNGAHAADLFAKEVSVDARTVAEAQVKAAVKSTEALEKEAAAYRAVAASAEKGSKEQVAAARLAAEADQRLARSIGTVGREASAAHAKTRNLERDLSHATRGAISGAGAMHGFGRSLAFASGGFIAFHSAADFLRESVDAAREAVVSQRALAAQMKASGESFSANREQIEKTALSFGKFGFQNDEVISGLTVLERGTGNVKKSLGLLTLTGDIARAKNIDFAQSATVVAKVFGGQETALRRAVPGLSKHAHGLELIGLASAKMRGQMAANTTAAERFHAVLHDTQEIVGTALLPTLNKYLDELSRWLERMNRSGKLQQDVARTTKFLGDAIAAVKAVVEPLVIAFKALADILGSNKRAMELLIGVYLSWKALKLAENVQATITKFFALGRAAEGQVGRIAKLRNVLLRLVANPYTVAIVVTFIGAEYVARKVKDLQESVIKAREAGFKKGEGVETTLVPALAKQIDAMKKAGESGAEIIAALRKKLGGSLKADDLIAEAFAFQSGSDPKMQARVRKQVDKRAGEVTKTAKDEVDKLARKGPTVEQRNTWFDQLMSRLLGGVEDTPTGAPAGLQTQLARLRHAADVLTARIAKTKDITRKLNLENQLQDVLNQEWQKQQEINQKTADNAQKAKDKRQQAVDNMIAALEVDVAKAGLTKTLTDDIARQKKLVAALREQVRATHGSAEAWQNLIAAQQELSSKQEEAAQQRQERIVARQFRQLGLTATGEEPIARLRALRAEFRQVQGLIDSGLVDADTKTKRRLRQIRTTLRDNSLAPEVRKWIQDFLDPLRDGTRKADADWTKFRAVNTRQVIAAAGLGGLGPKARSRLQGVLASLGPGMTMPAQASLAFAGQGGTTIHIANLHTSARNASELENDLTKRAKQRPNRRRGS